MFEARKIFIFHYLFLQFHIAVIAVGSETCKTPDNKAGRCVIITDCPSLLNAVTNKALDNDGANYLKSFHCGFVGTQPKVCCASDSNSDTSSDFLNWLPESHEINTTPPHDDLIPDLYTCGYIPQDLLSNGSHLTSYPWLVLLRYNTPDGSIFGCSGTLITNQHVLTAAHCVASQFLPETWKLASVRFGESNTDAETDSIEISKQTRHPKYNTHDTNLEHDIALLKLSRSVVFTRFVSPICLPLSSTFPKEPHESNFFFHHNSWKNESTVVLKKNSECEEKFKRKLNGDKLCTEGENACGVHGGGPLMTVYPESAFETNFFLLGVTSYGQTYCFSRDFVVYTRVSGYIPWIRDNL